MWVKTLMERRGPGPFSSLVDGELVQPPQAGLQRKRTSRVCGSCNHEMGVRFETPMGGHRGQGPIGQMIDGQAISIDSQTQAAVAGWVTKTLLMWSLHEHPTAFAPAWLYEWIRHQVHPPSNTAVWVAFVDYDGTSGGTRPAAPPDASMTEDSVPMMLREMRPHHPALRSQIRYQFLWMAAVSFTGRHVDSVRHPYEASGMVTRLWPSRPTEPLVWPPSARWHASEENLLSEALDLVVAPALPPQVLS